MSSCSNPESKYKKSLRDPKKRETMQQQTADEDATEIHLTCCRENHVIFQRIITDRQVIITEMLVETVKF